MMMTVITIEKVMKPTTILKVDNDGHSCTDLNWLGIHYNYVRPILTDTVHKFS